MIRVLGDHARAGLGICPSEHETEQLSTEINNSGLSGADRIVLLNILPQD
jgi:hypothetical protein